MSTHTYSYHYENGNVEYHEYVDGQEVHSSHSKVKPEADSKVDPEIDHLASKLERKVYKVSIVIAAIILLVIIAGIIYSLIAQNGQA